MVEALESEVRTVVGLSWGWSFDGDTGRIFAGDGDRRAVAPIWGRRAPLKVELAVPFALFEPCALE
jgi:hypothetical protein